MLSIRGEEIIDSGDGGREGVFNAVEVGKALEWG